MLGAQQRGYIQLQDLPGFFRNVTDGLVDLWRRNHVEIDTGDHVENDGSSQSDDAALPSEPPKTPSGDQDGEERPRRKSHHTRYNSTGTAGQVVEVTDESSPGSHQVTVSQDSHSESDDSQEPSEPVVEGPEQSIRSWLREAEAVVLQRLGVHADENMRAPAVRVPVEAIDSAIHQVHPIPI